MTQTKEGSKFSIKEAMPQLVGELVGTFILIFTAILSGAGNGSTEPPDLLIVALANGGVLGILVASLSPLKAGHFNPAVTLGLTIAGLSALHLFPLIVIVQIVGAAAAAWSLEGMGIAVSTLEPSFSGNLQSAMLIEALFTAILVGTVIGSAKVEEGNWLQRAVIIGLALFLGVLVAGRFSGGALNPVRTLYQYFDSSDSLVQELLLYQGGPLSGGIVAGTFWGMFDIATFVATFFRERKQSDNDAMTRRPLRRSKSCRSKFPR